MGESSVARRDPMRPLAWVLVVAGILIVVLSPVYLWYERSVYDDRFRAWQERSAPISSRDGLTSTDLLRSAMAGPPPSSPDINARPAMIIGIAVTTFGVLILAIRKPENKGGGA